MVNINTDGTFDALDALVEEQGGGSWSVRNGEIESWKGGTQPTDAQIQAKIDELKIKYDAEEWKRNRKKEYPTIDELVIALYDTDDKSAIEAKRAEVKAKYPKP
jgi:hypothetical protein